MSLPARTLHPTPSLEPPEAFERRVRPLMQMALAETLEAIPSGLGPVPAAVARAVGLDGRPGRRWRPFLALAVAEAVGGRAEDAVDAAVAVELTHTASLVLDDLPCMDDSPLRRGEPATHALLGAAGAILVAVGLLARAAELLGRSGPHGGELARRWGKTFGLDGMSGGQAVDLMLGGSCTGSMRRLYRRKTTALVVLAVDAGSLVADAPEVVRHALRGYGRDVGWAYQLVDDAKDRVEDAALGRDPGGRNPLRQARRLLDRSLARVEQLPDLAPGGGPLLCGIARTIVRIPSLMPVRPDQEATSC
ncbi:MAG: polyprenyl synthetase family protein [Gemmatimonadota bacterium]